MDYTDLINRLLANIGIVDGNIDVDGKKVQFSTLSPEEQLQILTPQENDDDNGLNDDEVDLVNQIRDSGMDAKTFLSNYGDYVIDKYKAEQEGNSYKVDDYSDDELYIADQKARFGSNPDYDDQKIGEMLAQAKQNPDTWNIITNGLREEYKNAEKNQLAAAEEAEKQRKSNEEKTEYEAYKNRVINAMSNMSDIDGIEMDDDERDSILSSIIDVDENGDTELDKALSNPDNLIKLAWFNKYGDAAFKTYDDAYDALKALQTTEPQATVYQTSLDDDEEPGGFSGIENNMNPSNPKSFNEITLDGEDEI